MAERKPFLLRLEPGLHQALQRWADDELRSLNGQIEYLLRESLRHAGRLPRPASASPTGSGNQPPAGGRRKP
jgi:hypothetical protein